MKSLVLENLLRSFDPERPFWVKSREDLIDEVEDVLDGDSEIKKVTISR
jgi:hypothetical protein